MPNTQTQTLMFCSKSAAGLSPCSLSACSHQGDQADMRMRSHCLLRLDDDKSAVSCQHAWCKLMLRFLIHKLDATCNKSDFEKIRFNLIN